MSAVEVWVMVVAGVLLVAAVGFGLLGRTFRRRQVSAGAAAPERAARELGPERTGPEQQRAEPGPEQPAAPEASAEQERTVLSAAEQEQPEHDQPPRADDQAGVDSALASLDSGRLATGLPDAVVDPTPNRVVMPSPRTAVDAADDEPAEPAIPPEPGPGTAPEPEPPYPGAVRALPDGSAPSPEFPVKGHLGSKRYYTEDSPFYARTTAHVWFRSAEAARSAGFTSSS